jgi:peptidoglycan hydrolase-like protein with peptidoglycan-binding domain
MTLDELIALVNQLQSQLGQAAPAAGGSCVSIPAPLTIGSQGADVTALQNFLIGAGMSIPAGATGYFGSQTQSALAAWQAANGVSPAVGYYGPITKAEMDAKCVPMTDGDDDMMDD